MKSSFNFRENATDRFLGQVVPFCGERSVKPMMTMILRSIVMPFPILPTHYDKDNAKPRKKPKTSKQIEESEAVQEMVASMTKKVVLMTMVMQNGKQLQDCTFKEISTFGSWFKLLATRGKPSEKVGEVLTEKDLQDLK